MKAKSERKKAREPKKASESRDVKKLGNKWENPKLVVNRVQKRGKSKCETTRN
jgi:hypothetical protein